MKNRMTEFEEWGADVIFGRIRGFGPWLFKGVLRLFSFLFIFIVWLRMKLFRKGYKEQANLGTMVISIGNITMGGTGKTPVVELFARTLRDHGRMVAILSRGYKSKKLGTPQTWHDQAGAVIDPELMPKVVSDGSQLHLDAEYGGDEPYMLAKNLDGVAVIVDKDRVKSGRFAIRELGSDLLLLDDGMQYLKLSHTLDIVLIDSNFPYGTGAMTPRGTLREPPKNLCRADYIFLTKCRRAGNEKLIQKIRRHNQVAEIIECTHGPVHLENVFTGEVLPLSVLDNTYVSLISGIAFPESFEEKISELGAHILFHHTFSDHYAFTQTDVDEFMQRCLRRDAELAITTEKDAVRFPHPTDLDVDIYFLRIEVDILSGQDVWQKLIARITDTPHKVDPLLLSERWSG